MKTAQLKFTLLLLAILMTTATACAQAPTTNANGQETQTEADKHAQADTIEIMSQRMGRVIKNVVIVPEQYFDADLQEEQYPVVYLLHGADGDYSNWPQKADLDDMASDYGVIFVCPDGQDSWYFDSPIDPKMQFETYVSQELVNYIDTHYRTYDNRYMRAITGLSMGGHGALWLAWRHPDVFWSCGSMSGNMDITKFANKWHINDRLGDYNSNQQRWAEHAVINLIPTLKRAPSPEQNIIIDDGVDDLFYQNNLELHQALLKAKIQHDFTIRPGNHTWTYWVNSLDYHILFFSKAFERGIELMESQP